MTERACWQGATGTRLHARKGSGVACGLGRPTPRGACHTSLSEPRAAAPAPPCLCCHPGPGCLQAGRRLPALACFEGRRTRTCAQGAVVWAVLQAIALSVGSAVAVCVRRPYQHRCCEITGRSEVWARAMKVTLRAPRGWSGLSSTRTCIWWTGRRHGDGPSGDWWPARLRGLPLVGLLVALLAGLPLGGLVVALPGCAPLVRVS
jgi:hypothetical protein